MIKRIYIITLILFFSSCSTLDLGYFSYIKEGLFPNRINIQDQNLLDEMQYSFIKASYKKNDAILVLSTIDDNNIYHWVGSQNEKILTYNGFIVFVSGFDLESLVETHSIKNLMDGLRNERFSIFYELSRPYLPASEFNFALLSTRFNESKNCEEYYYKKTNKFINFNSVEVFCFDANGQAIYTKQKINPLFKEIEIDFFYIYK